MRNALEKAGAAVWKPGARLGLVGRRSDLEELRVRRVLRERLADLGVRGLPSKATVPLIRVSLGISPSFPVRVPI